MACFSYKQVMHSVDTMSMARMLMIDLLKETCIMGRVEDYNLKQLQAVDAFQPCRLEFENTHAMFSLMLYLVLPKKPSRPLGLAGCLQQGEWMHSHGVKQGSPPVSISRMALPSLMAVFQSWSACRLMHY